MVFDASALPAPPDARTWGFVEGFAAETEQMRLARERSSELRATSVTPATGAALRMLVRANGAKHVVEIGNSIGGVALWLLAGLPADGQITSLDADGEHHRIARDLIADAGYSPAQARLITGKPVDVVARLTDQAYDLVVLALDSTELTSMLEQAIRLLRVGGLLVIVNAFGGGKVGDPAQRDPASVARRLVVQRCAADPRLTASLLPVGDGLLVAAVNSHEPRAE